MAEARSSVPSALLSDEENARLLSLVGITGQNKAAAVVQMFHAHPDPTLWTKFGCGVLCFVKDFVRRSYYIQLIDIVAGQLLFEQELYKQFVYCRDCSFFHSFAGDRFMIGLNFADETEAAIFSQAVNYKLKTRPKKAELAEHRHAAEFPHKHTIPDPHGLRIHTGRTRSQTVVGGPRPSLAVGQDTRRKSRRIKGRPLAIENPTRSKNAHRLVMLGFDPETGLFDARRITPQWRQLLESVGVTAERLRDKHTALFIADFVEKHGGIEEANRQLLEATRSPPSSPVRSRAKSVMVRRGKSYRGRGRRPPPEQMQLTPPSVGASGQINVPAAPPPPPIVGVLAPPPPPIPTITYATPTPRPSQMSGGLLADIQAGCQLRPVDINAQEKRERPLTGLAAALANALNMRSRVMRLSDEDDDCEAMDDDTDGWISD